MNWKPVRYSAHAAARRKERRVPAGEVRRIVATGEDRETGDQYRARRGTLADGRLVEVIYLESRDAIFVVTVQVVE